MDEPQYRHWQSQGIHNTIEGSNYLRAGELRGIIDELERLKAMEDLAHHLRHCRYCGETDVDDCAEGKELWRKGFPDDASEKP